MRTITAGLAEFEIMPGGGSSQGHQTRPPAGSTPSKQEDQAGARHACRRAVLSAHCPQRRMGKTTVMEIVRRGVGR